MPRIQSKTHLWTYGVEHELGDWDTRQGWKGFDRDPEPNICNSNGIAGDPTLKDYPFGAELNTRPTKQPEDQGSILENFLNLHKRCYVSHRVGMHVHIRIPGLETNLPLLKRIQRYNLESVEVWKLVDPLPKPLLKDYLIEAEFKAARKWSSVIRRSHWTMLSRERVAIQLQAVTCKEFFRLEAPVAKRTGKPMFHAQPRATVNLRQLLQTGTIEFRPFFQTLDPAVVVTSIKFCRDYLKGAIEGVSSASIYADSTAARFPKRPVYEFWRDRRWLATTHCKNKRVVVRANIEKILAGKFDDVSNDQFEHLQV